MTIKSRNIMIFVPEKSRASAIDVDDIVRGPSIGDAIGKVNTVPAGQVEAQWNETLDVLLSLSDAISQRAAEWKIDEIEVGLTLSAKGELLFIAEAGAEASIKLSLKPKN